MDLFERRSFDEVKEFYLIDSKYVKKGDYWLEYWCGEIIEWRGKDIEKLRDSFENNRFIVYGVK